MNIFIPKESNKDETRVAASPDTVKKLIAHGCQVSVEKGAGALSKISNRSRLHGSLWK